MRSIGLDVHLEFCEVAIAEEGEVRAAGRIETKPAELELFARSLGKDDRVALEVTGNAWEIKRLIEPHVGEVIVVSPADTGIRSARAKTDRLDARTLAKLCAAGELDPGLGPGSKDPGDAPTAPAPKPARRRKDEGKERVHAALMRALVAAPRSPTCSAGRAAPGSQSSSSLRSSASRSTPH